MLIFKKLRFLQADGPVGRLNVILALQIAIRYGRLQLVGKDYWLLRWLLRRTPKPSIRLLGFLNSLRL